MSQKQNTKSTKKELTQQQLIIFSLIGWIITKSTIWLIPETRNKILAIITIFLITLANAFLIIILVSLPILIVKTIVKLLKNR